MTFWWRRWIEQSRSPRWIVVAVLVGDDLDLDVARVGQVALEVDGRVAEELLALARRRPRRRSRARPRSATRKPLPPPPPAALTATGKPMSVLEILRAVSTSGTGSVVPGTIGTPAACMSSRARVLEPIASIADDGGPMKTMPSSSRRRTNGAFSARKP
jgi:hypothetical protein